MEGKKRDAMRMTSINLPLKMIDDLDAASYSLGIAKSVIIRNAIRAYLNNTPKEEV
jgi:predicted DNA-binding protein